jgi:hypothetical protein
LLNPTHPSFADLQVEPLQFLRPRRERPRRSGVAKQPKEIAPFHCTMPPVLRIKDSTALLHCVISTWLMTAAGQTQSLQRCPLHDRFSTKNRHSPAPIERPFRANRVTTRCSKLAPISATTLATRAFADYLASPFRLSAYPDLIWEPWSGFCPTKATDYKQFR